jgi:hypothetical protein
MAWVPAGLTIAAVRTLQPQVLVPLRLARRCLPEAET